MKTKILVKVGRTIGMTILGAMVGVGVGGFLIIVGILLSLTVIGAILGIPLILIGIMFIIAGPIGGGVGGFLATKKECPVCQSPLIFIMGQRVVKCQACKQRIIIKGTGKNSTLEVLSI